MVKEAIVINSDNALKIFENRVNNYIDNRLKLNKRIISDYNLNHTWSIIFATPDTYDSETSADMRIWEHYMEYNEILIENGDFWWWDEDDDCSIENMIKHFKQIKYENLHGFDGEVGLFIENDCAASLYLPYTRCAVLFPISHMTDENLELRKWYLNTLCEDFGMNYVCNDDYYLIELNSDTNKYFHHPSDRLRLLTMIRYGYCNLIAIHGLTVEERKSLLHFKNNHLVPFMRAVKGFYENGMDLCEALDTAHILYSRNILPRETKNAVFDKVFSFSAGLYREDSYPLSQNEVFLRKDNPSILEATERKLKLAAGFSSIKAAQELVDAIQTADYSKVINILYAPTHT